MSNLKAGTSADIAARFVARREAKRRRSRAWRKQQQRTRATRQRAIDLSRGPAAPPERRAPRRIAFDLAEPTVRLIHDVLCDALHAGINFGDRFQLLMIAEQMVAQALGIPPCDDPPLTDRVTPR